MSKPIKVPFHGTNLVVIDIDGEPFTPLKAIVEGMGLAWHGQFEKLKANEGRWGIRVTRIPSKGGKQEAACIPLRKLAGWLMTLHPSRVKPELREKITTYQNECDDALWKYWNEGTAQRRAKPGANALTVQPALDKETLQRINRHAWGLAQATFERYRRELTRSIELRVHVRPIEDWKPEEFRVGPLRGMEAAAISCEQFAKNIRNQARKLAEMSGTDYEQDVHKHFFGETPTTPASSITHQEKS